MSTGRLYGVGLGPGDPELVTVKAARLIAAADVVAFHAAQHGRSVARAVAAPYLREGQVEELLVYPVTTETTDHPGGYQGAIDEFYEAAVGELDGGRCLSFATGMAAISAAVLAVVRAGDRVVLPSDGYYATRLLARDELERYGVTVEYVPTPEIGAVAARGDLEGARLVLLETPSNPLLDVCDVAAVACATRAAGAVLAVDNTTATPLGQRPLALGADLTVGSDTKALTGHSDLLLGHVSTRDEELYARLKSFRDHTGGTPGPFEAWLGHRSMSTLDLRLARQAATAAAVADLLAAHPAASGVRWPWRPGDPSYDLAARQMLRPNGIVSAELPDAAAVARLVAAGRLWTAATSFGGVHSTVDRRAQWGGDAVPEGFVRLSCGIEDTADLVADLTAALDAV